MLPLFSNLSIGKRTVWNQDKIWQEIFYIFPILTTKLKHRKPIKMEGRIYMMGVSEGVKVAKQ